MHLSRTSVLKGTSRNYHCQEEFYSRPLPSPSGTAPRLRTMAQGSRACGGTVDRDPSCPAHGPPSPSDAVGEAAGCLSHAALLTVLDLCLSRLRCKFAQQLDRSPAAARLASPLGSREAALPVYHGRLSPVSVFSASPPSCLSLTSTPPQTKPKTKS